MSLPPQISATDQVKPKPQLLQFLRKNWLPTAVLVGACFLVIWFLTRAALDFVHFNDPKHQDADLKGWMTPRYIVRSYDLPRSLVFDTLGLQDPDRRGVPLRRIAEDMGLTLEELTDLVREVAEEHRASKP
ncbi:MAG: hypothetical protein OXQ92_11185 [Boseongicola sp.]|nr:hypothetical protein [Boseongicola sp.]MDD9977954.1 hypothetical protein [Boseongicola sp.]